MLKIRPFVKGIDEANFVRIYNTVFSDYEDNRSMTLKEMEEVEKSPSFDPEGILIAEFDGMVAGMINAHVDRLRTERKGFIQSLGVLPEFRGKGIAKTLLEEALESFRKRGMKVVEAAAQSDREACVHIFESFGFKQARSTSLMKTSLSATQSSAGESKDVRMREMRLTDEEEIGLLNRLLNEVFKEHFNYRPQTVAETKYMLFELPWYKRQAAFFAELDAEPVGFVVTGIDEGINKEKGVNWGWILEIGVLKPHRRKDIGTSLMHRGMGLLKKQDMNDALLYVDDLNPTKAIKLYEKVGFRTAQKYLVYLLNLA